MSTDLHTGAERAPAMPARDDSYAALLARLYATRRFGVRLGLDRIQRCLERLGDPQARPRVRVQIGGTNGKGSTAAFLEALLRRAGLRTGLFTSPHLSRLQERFCVDGAPLPAAAIVDAGRAVERAERAAGLTEPMTFFEHVTAMAAWAFARAEVDVAIMEVGLGGRFDATTAFGADVAAVTGVALDHESILGGTLAEIAAEKAGIFRAGQRAVVGASGEADAVPLLTRAALAAGVADLLVAEAGAEGGPGDWHLGLAGAHQRANAACALAVLDQLEALGVARVEEESRRLALAETFFPGRMERVALPGGGQALLDGAHNPHAAHALARALRQIECQRLVAVLGVSQGKDAHGIVAPLVAGAREVVVTRSRQDRAMSPEELAGAVRRARPDLEPLSASTTAEALRCACARASAGDLVLVAGSLFVVGEAREQLCQVEPDPVPLSDPHGTRDAQRPEAV